uniref:Variant surface glycoprotein n=1 Tax=Trypanosoma brucei TaxID=5691 RepID=A0A1V0FZA1_9TRYP|nr:variant surface glycoprotein [Trypanosoma brucei]
MQLFFPILTVATVFLIKTVRPAQYDAIAPFQAICTSWALATKANIQDYSPPTLPSEVDDLLQINMSVSSNKWLEMFKTAEGKQSWDAYRKKFTDLPSEVNWEKSWENWKQQAAVINKHESNWNKNRRPRRYGPLQGFHIEIINATANEVQKLIDEIKEPPKTPQGTTYTEAIRQSL